MEKLIMKRILAALLLIPSIALGQVTTNPGVTGVVGTGTTGSGSVVLQNSPTITGTLTAAAGTFSGTLASGTHAVTGTITASAIASAAGNELLCYNTAGGVITYAATVLGCVPSGLQFKNPIAAIEPKRALRAVMKLEPGYGTFKDTEKFGTQEYVWLYADHVCAMDEKLCKRDAKGRPENYDKYGTVAYIVAAMKEQQVQIRRLQREVKQLQKEQYVARQSKIRPAAYVVH